MINKLKKEDLIDYVVRIEYKKGDSIERASGVIIKSSSSIFYILTVKHILKDRYNTPLEKVSENINIDNLLVKNYLGDKIEIDKVIFLKDKNLDLILLKLKFSIEGFIDLKIYPDTFYECSVFGYPRSREKTYNSMLLPASHPDRVDFDSNSFEIRANMPLQSFEKSETDNIKGLSGSGVFIKGKSGRVYLVGIQYAYMPITSLTALNLRVIKEDIDEVIEGEVLVSEYPFFEKLGIDINKIVFDSLDEYFSNKEMRKFKKRLTRNRKKELEKLEKQYLSLKQSMRILADKYFYLGKEYFEKGNFSKSYGFFSRAIELCPSYKHFFAKSEFSKDILTDEQIREREELDSEFYLVEDSPIMSYILEDEEDFLKKKGDFKSLERLYLKLIRLPADTKDKIVNIFLKLSDIKFKNNKLSETENILFFLRDGVEDDTVIKKEIDSRLLKLLDIYKKNNIVSDTELLTKYIYLKDESFNNKKELIHIISTLKFEINHSYNPLCKPLIKYMNSQIEEVEKLEAMNSELLLENAILREKQRYNFFIKFKKNIYLTLFILVLAMMLAISYFNLPVLDWIEKINLNFFKKLIFGLG